MRRGGASNKRSRPSAPNGRPAEDPRTDEPEPMTPGTASPISEAPIEEDLENHDDDQVMEEEEIEGEDLLGDNMEDDYKPMPELDVYDMKDIDETEYSAMDPEQRRRAEAALARRDKDKAQREGARLPAALLDESDEEVEDEEARRKRRRQLARAELAAEGDLIGDANLDDYVDLNELKGRPQDWLDRDNVRNEIKRRFRTFLAAFREHADHEPYYVERIVQMCADNGQSLEVQFSHITKAQPLLGIWLADVPTELLKLFNEVALQCVLDQFPRYGDVHSEIFVRIAGLPVNDSLRDLRQTHMNTLIKVSGVVTRRTGVFPQLKQIYLDCSKCGCSIGPIIQTGTDELRPGSCPDCQSKGPFTVNMEKTVYRNYQKITLQESPGTVPPGRVPRHKDVILLADLIDIARPGDEVEVTGIYCNRFDVGLNFKHGFPVFATVLEANYVRRKGDIELSELTDDEKAAIRQLAQDPRIGERIIESIAPSIYGETHIKTALALSMFGGQPKDVNDKHRIRGDINVLLLGDPGVAKSQFLKYVEKTFHRTVYTTGKGASAVGLTAAVHRDPITREWTLEGGALVLADRGVCLIDEFDKMNEQDRTSIHEAMEQQSISISKAGIVTTLQARCAVIAAANPLRGRYDPQLSFIENVDLTDPILSRFDCLCVVRDEVDAMRDEQLASFVINSHVRSHPSRVQAAQESGQPLPDLLDSGIFSDAARKAKDVLDQETLKKYILYARQYVHPKLTDIDQDKIANFYAELRKESINSGGVPVAVRHIESLMRMAEAHARLHLREYVRDEDIDAAIAVMLESFIQSQKYQIGRTLRRRFQRYITAKRDHNELLLFMLQRLVRERSQYLQIVKALDDVPPTVEIDLADLQAEASAVEIFDLSTFYESDEFKLNNFTLDRRRGVIIKSF